MPSTRSAKAWDSVNVPASNSRTKRPASSLHPNGCGPAHNERWSQGQTANSSIGQGYVLATPLQMAMITATVANGGSSYQPSLIYQIQEPDGTSVRRPDKVRGDLTKMNNLTPDQIEIVRKGMWRVVNDSGTGARAKVPGVTLPARRAPPRPGPMGKRTTTPGSSLSHRTTTRNSPWQ